MTVVPSPTWLSSIRLLGPMTQPGPMTVDPRRMVPGRMRAPGAIWTVSSMTTAVLSIRTPLAICRSRISMRACSGGFQRGACGAQRLGVVFHIKRPPYNERKRDLAPSARPAMTGRRRRMGRPRKGTSEPIPVYINVKAAFFQGKCTNLLIQNRQILVPNSWILCA